MPAQHSLPLFITVCFLNLCASRQPCRILYKLDELVRPYVHKILVVIEPLLIDEDYYARVEGREIIANLSKAAGKHHMQWLVSWCAHLLRERDRCACEAWGWQALR